SITQPNRLAIEISLHPTSAACGSIRNFLHTHGVASGRAEFHYHQSALADQTAVFRQLGTHGHEGESDPEA
ncbi:MAG TPA: hypothetical protein VKG87_08015, partial [Terriglobales bacterium]|nr:hypothetical protein [Terriglobales bacterium]